MLISHPGPVRHLNPQLLLLLLMLQVFGIKRHLNLQLWWRMCQRRSREIGWSLINNPLQAILQYRGSFTTRVLQQKKKKKKCNLGYGAKHFYRWKISYCCGQNESPGFIITMWKDVRHFSFCFTAAFKFFTNQGKERQV